MLLAWLLDLVLPRVCPGCGVTLFQRAPVCERCLAALRARPVRARPSPCPAGLPATWAVAGYDAPVRDLVVAHKERGRLALSAPLAEALAVAAACARPDALVWVPSSRRAIRARGYDHARRLAVRAARLLGVPALPALCAARRTADQSGLSAAERAANLAGAFAAHPAAGTALAGLRVVVVDDVMTTGATLAEAARALREAGVSVAGAAVVAAGVRRPPPRRAPSPATARSADAPLSAAAASVAVPPRLDARRAPRGPPATPYATAGATGSPPPAGEPRPKPCAPDTRRDSVVVRTPVRLRGRREDQPMRAARERGVPAPLRATPRRSVRPHVAVPRLPAAKGA